jgi:hypothetical protein
MARNAGLAHAKPVLAAHAVGPERPVLSAALNGGVKRLAEQVAEIARSVPFGNLPCRAHGESAVEEGAQVNDRARLDPSLLHAFSLRGPLERRRPHHNILLEGAVASTNAVLDLLVPRLAKPVVWKRRGEPFALPTGEIGTLVLEDASNLDCDSQSELCQWLADVNPCPRVVCTTARPLFGLVVSGLFDVDLYYRLNVMLLHVDIRHQAGRPLHATLSEAPKRCDRDGRA